MTMFKYEGPGWYKMRNGGKVWVGCDLRDSGNSFIAFPIRGAVITDGCISEISWTGDGRDGSAGDYDLIGPWTEPRKVKLWVNVYDDLSPDACDNRLEANEWASHWENKGKKRIACVEIEVTEGEGL